MTKANIHFNLDVIENPSTAFVRLTRSFYIEVLGSVDAAIALSNRATYKSDPVGYLSRTISYFLKAYPDLCIETVKENALIAINLPESNPSDISIYINSLNCPIFFSCKDSAVKFKKSWLFVPINLSNTFFLELLDRQAAKYLESINIEEKTKSNEFLLIFQKNLGKGIEAGTPTLDFVAREMAFSKSTLKKRLIAHDLNFQILLDKARLELAKIYFKDQHLSLAEISSLLAFSEQSAFNRFFKRVTGLSPRKYRVNFILK